MLNGYRGILPEVKPLKEDANIKGQAYEVYFKFYASLNKPDLLARLYFPALNHHRGRAFNAACDILEFYNAALRSGVIPNKVVSDKTITTFNDRIQELQELAMKDHEQLTRNPALVILNLFS